MKIDHIAVQLYTLRDLTGQDMLGTLRQVATIGYRAVEFAGFGNATPQAVRATLDEAGMQAVAAHVPTGQLEKEIEQVIADLQTLGCRYAVVPWVGEEYRGGAAQTQTLATKLNDWARRLQTEGIQLAYHNHDFEFATSDGTTMWEQLVAQTDPAFVTFELDVYWAAHARYDPSTLIERHGSRIALLHLKDRAAEPPHGDTPVGHGTMPWKDLLDAADANGIQWGIVEQDNPRNPMDDVRRSYEYLQGLVGDR